MKERDAGQEVKNHAGLGLEEVFIEVKLKGKQRISMVVIG